MSPRTDFEYLKLVVEDTWIDNHCHAKCPQHMSDNVSRAHVITLHVKIAKLLTEDCSRCVRIQVNAELWEEFSVAIGAHSISNGWNNAILENK